MRSALAVNSDLTACFVCWNSPFQLDHLTRVTSLVHIIALG